MDVSAGEFSGELNALKSIINLALPQGIEIDYIKILAPGEKSLAHALFGFSYEMNLPPDTGIGKVEMIKDNIDKFLAATSFNISRLSKGKSITKDIRPFVKNMILDNQKKLIQCTLLFSQKGSARPSDILTHVAGLNEAEIQQTRTVKTKTILI